jgi:uncharacterized membrane protein YoaK (UPF0700 family)
MTSRLARAVAVRKPAPVPRGALLKPGGDLETSPDRRQSEVADHRLRDAYVIILAIVSGATDAFGYFGLGGSFTSVMTGNMVLFGVAAAGRDGRLAFHVLTAILGYIAGTVVGARIAGTHKPTDPVWPVGVTVALAAELALSLATGVAWLVTGAAPTTTVQLALLLISACGLGIQSAAIVRFGVPGLSTTYLTGTLTTLFAGLAAGKPIRAMRRGVLILVGLVTGAAASTLLLTQVRLLAPIVPFALLATVVVGATYRFALARKPSVTSAESVAQVQEQ